MNHTFGDGNDDEPSWIAKEIQLMMYGFGDSSKPLLSSAMLIEEIVIKQLRLTVFQAEEVAQHRGSSVIQPEHIVFLMRKDKAKLQRLIKYLHVKDIKEKGLGKLTSVSDSEILNYLNDWKHLTGKRTQQVLGSLASLDPTFHLHTEVEDVVKHERNVRADKLSNNMKPEEYATYVNSRRASFSNTAAKVELLYKRIFSEEIGTPKEPNVSLACYDIIGYLGYETVQQIIDLTLLVRQDSYAKVGDPISRYIPPAQSFPYTVHSNIQVEGAPPLTVGEIREALRRYWSPQFSPFNPSRTHVRLLAM